jgi:PIN domain nuclease of toxin-antitoxin system
MPRTLPLSAAQSHLADIVAGMVPGEEVTLTTQGRCAEKTRENQLAQPAWHGQRQLLVDGTRLQCATGRLCRVSGMTTLLLDTHTVLWFWWDDPQLSTTARTLITEPANRKLVSTATPWEVAIKVSRRKLDIGTPFRGFFDQHMIRTYFEWLQIATKHVDALADLPYYHNDPFDRMIAVQAATEKIPIVSADSQFDLYGVRRLW